MANFVNDEDRKSRKLKNKYLCGTKAKKPIRIRNSL